jgi:prepilin-type N-terminal cleavage/methylation domain-containing protein
MRSWLRGADSVEPRSAAWICRPRRAGGAGFTLIELAVTLALVLVLAAIALPRFVEAYGNFQAESILRDLEKEIRYAQYHAVMEGRRLLFRYDRPKNTYELLQEKKEGPSIKWIPLPAPWGRKKKIPDAFTLSAGGKHKILFFPDGTVSETALALRSGSEETAVLEIGRTLRGAVIVRKRSHVA